MGNTNTPYIGKAAQPLVNPTAITVFQQMQSPIATVASTQAAKAVFLRYAGYAQFGSGVSNNIDIVQIIVRAAGRVVGGTTTNFTPTLQFNTSIPSVTAGSNTTIGSLTPIAFNSASGNFKFAADLTWDPISGQINGTFGGYGGSNGAQTLTATGAITPITGVTVAVPTTVLSQTVATPVTAPTGEGNIFFAVAGLFSASNANNIAYLDSFDVEVN